MNIPVFIKSLRNLIGADNVYTDHVSAYCQLPFSGDLPVILPLAVVAPVNCGQVKQIISLCAEKGVQIRIRGGGTTIIDRQWPLHGDWIILQTTNLNRILDFDKDNNVITLQAGVRLSSFVIHIQREGLYFPVMPWFPDIATIGGHIAASKPYILNSKYLSPAAYVRELIAFGSHAKELTLYSYFPQSILGGRLALAPLYCGSAGRLGLIAQLTLQLMELPSSFITVVANFPDEETAISIVSELNAAQDPPEILEFLDEKSAAIIDLSARSTLIIRYAGKSANNAIKDLVKIIDQSSGKMEILNSAQAADIWQKRGRLPFAFAGLRKKYAKENLIFLPDKLFAVLECIRQIETRLNIEIAAYGSALSSYLELAVFSDEKDKTRQALREIFNLQMVLMNLLSSEKDLKLDRKDWLEQNQRGIDGQIQRKIQQAFDPASLFCEEN